MNRLFTLFGMIFLIAVTAIAQAEEKVDYPHGYRYWYHVKSMVILPGHPLENPFQGIHHIYANSRAMKGLKSGDFADGSVFVFDLLHHEEENNAIVEGERKLIGVMRKDAEKFASTGGWGFEGFAGESKTERLTKDGGQSCFECHQSQEENQYVFTQLRD